VIDQRWVGRPLARREDVRFITGTASYVDDAHPAGLAFLAVVRSPFAHARLSSIDGRAAQADDRVLTVLTASELPPEANRLPLRVLPLPDDLFLADVPVPVFARELVHFSGQPVAAVVADSAAAAADAVELVSIDYDPLTVVTDPGTALGNPTVLHPQAPENALLRWQRTNGDVDGAIARARHVVKGHFQIPRQMAAPIEPRGCLAGYDRESDLLTLTCSAQDQHRVLLQLCATLKRPTERTHVIVPDVGGAFGSKGGLAPEHVMACVAAMKTGRPVKWIETRSENFLGVYQGRGLIADAELAVDPEGRFTALRVRLISDMGAFMYGHTMAPAISVVPLLTGVYHIKAASAEITGVASNKVPTGPCRGAGRPEATFIIERLVDMAAQATGLDAAELRRRNLIPADAFPYRNPLGAVYDSGNYQRALAEARRIGDYDGWRRRQQVARERGGRIGIGLSTFVESSGAGAWESAAASLETDGRVLIKTGSTSHGQGHDIAFAQIAAETLGVAPESIQVRQGDSFVVPPGVGTYGARSLTVGGSAVASVAGQLRDRIRAWAGHLLDADDSELIWRDGRFSAEASRNSVSLAEIARAAATGPQNGLEPLAVSGKFTMQGLTYPSGAYMAVVEVDVETGKTRILRLVGVDDSGRITNPVVAEGQVVGGAAHGIGEALYEVMLHDEQGQPLTGSFVSYSLPTAGDVETALHFEFQETPSPLNPLGAKGVGESGAIATPVAIVNAIVDALQPAGVTHLDMPVLPERIWEVVRRGRR